MCDVDDEAVVAAVDAPSIYDIPKVLHAEGLDAYVVRRLDLPFRDVDWTALGRAAAAGAPPGRGGHGRAGRQVRRPARRLPVGRRGAARRRVRQRGPGQHPLGAPPTSARPARARPALLGDVDAVCVPGGFGVRGIEGKVGALRYAREPRIPTLGLCLGLQCMVIEFARHVAGLDRRRLDRVRPRHAAPGDRDDGRAEGDRRGRGRPGRHDAARALPGRPDAGLARRRRRTAPRGSRSGTGTATRSTTPTAASSSRPGWCSPGCRRTASWSSSSSCRARCTRTTCDPGAPGAQVPPDPAAPAVPRAGRGRAGPAARAPAARRRDRACAVRRSRPPPMTDASSAASAPRRRRAMSWPVADTETVYRGPVIAVRRDTWSSDRTAATFERDVIVAIPARSAIVASTTTTGCWCVTQYRHPVSAGSSSCPPGCSTTPARTRWPPPSASWREEGQVACRALDDAARADALTRDERRGPDDLPRAKASPAATYRDGFRRRPRGGDDDPRLGALAGPGRCGARRPDHATRRSVAGVLATLGRPAERPLAAEVGR